MSNIKTLRNKAINLIDKNNKIIDGRTISKLYNIAYNAKTPKLNMLIKSLEETKQEVTQIKKHQNNRLDDGIDDSDDMHIYQKTSKPKQLTLKNIVGEKHKIIYDPKVDIDLRINIDYRRIGKTRKSEKIHNKDIENVNLTVSIPKSKVNDLEYIEYYLLNDHDLSQYIHENDTFEVIDIKNIKILSSPVVKSDFFKSKYDIKQIKMKHAEYVNLDIDGIKDYDFEPFKCVYGALKSKYGFDEEYLLGVFQSYVSKYDLNNDIFDEQVKILNLTDGVSTNMVLHLAKLRDFSVYALDVNKKYLQNIFQNIVNLKHWFLYCIMNIFIY